jgi:hypothetical protein
VQCNFAQPTFGACTDANKRHLADELSAQYHDLVEILQFTPPALSTATGRFMPGAVPGYDADSYLAYLATKDVGLCQLEAGSYRAIDKTLSVCVDPLIRDGSEDIRAVVRHELFHAIQHAYEPLRREALSNPDRARWLMEGTAWAAEQSGVTMKRSSVQPLRPVTVTLTSEIYERSAQSQDFWVYTGRTSALTFLSPILARGAFAESVAAELKLAEAYWQWSKNQAYEKTDPLGIEGKTPCAVDPDVVSVGLTVNHPDGPFGALTLTPLTSALIELKFIKEDAFKVIGIGASPAEEGAVIRMEDLRFKVYTEHGNCAEDLGEGGLQLNRRIAAGERFLILVANTSVTGSMKVALELSIIPN